jgi:hypothetical protein
MVAFVGSLGSTAVFEGVPQTEALAPVEGRPA